MSMYLHAAGVELGFDDLFICSGNDMMAWIGWMGFLCDRKSSTMTVLVF